jgi:PAS domain S-box-containing protein
MVRSLSQAQKEELLETLWDRSLVGIAILSKEGTFEYANNAFCKLVEYSEPELQRRRFHDITHPDDLMADNLLAADVADGRREDYMMKKRYITKTGKLVWVVLSVQPLCVNGEFHYFISQVSEVFPIIGVTVPVIPPVKPDIFSFISKNYPWMVLMLGGVSYTIAEILKNFTK